MLIRLQSMTVALRMKDRLIREGIPSQVVQSPKSMQKNGCGYSLQIERKHLPAVKKIAGEMDIRIIGVHEDV
ncbi:MAG: DUF3343 domain-containing protein [Clostridia bacterium]|nr:DUF3343 domain-containing protein [Clostridia bacterium]